LSVALLAGHVLDLQPRGALTDATPIAAARAIPDTVLPVLGPDARAHLFGSRSDDRLRGGEIDLLVEAAQAEDRPAVASARIGARLQQALGDRRPLSCWRLPMSRPSRSIAWRARPGSSL
jgi:hypothetical protein